jgi:hypothetical protein
MHLAGEYLIGVHVIGGYLTGIYLSQACILKGRRTFIPIEEATRPAGVLCGMGWGDQVPLNGSESAQLGEMDAESGGLYRRFLLPPYPR